MGAGSDALDPIFNPRAWDVIKVQGVASPGICKLSGFKRGFGWTVKKGKGAKGSTVTLDEYPPAEGTVTISIWEPEHFESWREFRDTWNYDPTKKPISAVDIFHPALADLDITRVVCKSIGALEHQGKGLYQATIELIEYNPPPKKKADATPSGSSGASNKAPGGTDDPVADAQQAEIARLLRSARGEEKPDQPWVPQRAA